MNKMILVWRILPWMQSRRFRFLLSTFLVLGLGLSDSLWQSLPLKAQYSTTTNSRTAASRTSNSRTTWQYAAFPVENFQGYTSLFGYRISPTTGQSQFHQGIDIAAPVGSYVRNWWAGTVVSLSDNTACGTMIKIQSGQWTHVYCHLLGKVESSLQGRYLLDREGGIVLWEGQTVPAGVRMARVGMSGRTTGPHLHWGLMYGKEWVDPALVLQQMLGQQAAL